ncbi:MAG TPA: hypothetical protein VF139_17585 [Candidatus Polarisedimenticolaceae bacterium]
MRILGADLGPLAGAAAGAEGTLVRLDGQGRVDQVRRPDDPPALVRDVAELAGGEAFTLAVDVPILAPRGSKGRPVDNAAKRRLGRRPPRREDGEAWQGPALLGAFASAGHPCLPWPDRDRRQSGLAETWPDLVAKILVWQGSAAAAAGIHPDRDAAFRGYALPPYRASSRAEWPERASALDLALRGLGFQEDLDLRPAWDALAVAGSERDVERAGALLDATLAAFAAARYLEAPEDCVFLGDRESGYAILPADGFVRRLALRDAAKGATRDLFPKASLRDRLAPFATVRPLELVEIPGRPQRLEAAFEKPPVYEFDNLDEMLWWKHCRHLTGPELPMEGLQELVVRLGHDGNWSDGGHALRLLRSRHKVLSFRFEPPAVWRGRVATRDGKAYAFQVVRATYEAK